MVKKFTANCQAQGKTIPVTLYVGNPAIGSHPLNFQNRWLSDEKGLIVPPNIMRSFSKLVEISEKHRVPFEDLCGYVIDELKATNSIVDDAKGASALSDKNKKDQKPEDKKDEKPEDKK